jgi:glycerophosphoryl diester phosphodiesterase
MIVPPTHPFLENTIPSIRAAFGDGADIVQIQIHHTADGQFAVFHDWTLDCRTNGHGETNAHTMAELKTLDIGYGYTADGGKTFPFRGKGVGLMPSLDDVLSAFPDRRLLLTLKSDDPREGTLLAARLSRLPKGERARLMVLVAGPKSAAVLRRLDGVRIVGEGQMKACLIGYLGIGWSGYVPASCRHTIVMVPLNYTWAIWGWPDRFVARLKNEDSDVFVAGDYGGGDAAGGIDTPEQLGRLPISYSGGIWTDEIGTIGPLVRQRRAKSP